MAMAGDGNGIVANDENDLNSDNVMYNWRVKSVYKALKEHGVSEGGAVSVEQLTSLGHLDQYHYLGADATKACARTLGLTKGRRVLDIGSGIGGPSRMLSALSGCEVVGIEVQKDLVEASQDLTRRAGLAPLVSFRCGDAADPNVAIENEYYHHAISLLVLLHIPKEPREKVMKRMFDALVEGGTILLEDFVLRPGAKLEEKERTALKDIVHAHYVPSASAYKAELEAQGFVDVSIEDMSETWKRWTRARSLDFELKKHDMEDMYGADVVASRSTFYKCIDDLFDGNNIGGARIIARKPFTNEVEKILRHSLTFQGHDMAAKDTLVREGIATGVQKIHENRDGNMLHEAQGESRAQPAYPAPGNWKHLHDSLQYHFVVPSKQLCFAARVFYTPSMYHHSVWARTADRGAWEVVGSDIPMDGNKDKLILSSSGLRIQEENGAGQIVVNGKSANESFTISFEEQSVFAWLPAGQSESVIHRPNLKARIRYRGETFDAWGYSKRYFGDYPSHWGYRFIHGIAKSGNREAIVWTADATFGLSKYNYFHVLMDGRHLHSKAENTYQQFSKAYGILGCENASAALEELPESEWIREIKNSKMSSCMRQRFCKLNLVVGIEKFTGFAVNETCFGTLM